MTRNTDGTLTEKGREELRSLLWKAFFGFMSLVGTGGVWVLVSQAQQYGNNFVARAPSTIANTEAVAFAQNAVVVAQKTADTANAKADQGLALDGKIFDAVKGLRDDIGELKLAVAASNATTAAEISGLGKQADRIESRQDSAK